MKYLLDTNHWSYLQRNHPNVLIHLQNLPDNATIYMPVVAQAELLAGIELVVLESHKQKFRDLYEQIVAEFTEIVYIDSDVAEKYALIFTSLKRKGRPIETNDIWIAAIALAYDMILVTNDEHFQYIDGLQIEDWTK
jgi:tRNA(fMet)-specific endonuclease VapC